ncbi:hypothetical protein PAJ34TS1_49250 [Paenibacillus azoreducens]
MRCAKKNGRLSDKCLAANFQRKRTELKEMTWVQTRNRWMKFALMTQVLIRKQISNGHSSRYCVQFQPL